MIFLRLIIFVGYILKVNLSDFYVQEMVFRLLGVLSNFPLEKSPISGKNSKRGFPEGWAISHVENDDLCCSSQLLATSENEDWSRWCCHCIFFLLVMCSFTSACEVERFLSKSIGPCFILGY